MPLFPSRTQVCPGSSPSRRLRCGLLTCVKISAEILRGSRQRLHRDSRRRGRTWAGPCAVSAATLRSALLQTQMKPCPESDPSLYRLAWPLKKVHVLVLPVSAALWYLYCKSCSCKLAEAHSCVYSWWTDFSCLSWTSNARNTCFLWSRF